MTTSGTWYPPSLGTGGFLLTNPPFAPMDQPLSPTAQVVLDAMHRSYDHEQTRRAIAAGIIRALAEIGIVSGPLTEWNPDDRTRRELHNIADELEAKQ